MHALALAVALAAPPAGASPKAPAPTPAAHSPARPADRAAKLVIDPANPVHDIDVAFAFTTTVWFPVNCRSVTVGDPETFGAIIDERFKNRVVITPLVDTPGAKSNVTVDCEQNVRVVLALSLGDANSARQIVEFEFSKEDVALVRSAVDGERKRCAAEQATKLSEARHAAEQEGAEHLLQAMLRRVSAVGSKQYARQDFVVVKAYRQVVIGTRAYLLFQIQNRSPRDFVLKGVELAAAKGGQALEVLALSVADRRVAPDAVMQAAVAFETPDESSAVTLTVLEDGPRTIKVEGIDF